MRQGVLKAASVTALLFALAALFAAFSQPWPSMISALCAGYSARVAWTAFEELARAAERRPSPRRNT